MDEKEYFGPFHQKIGEELDFSLHLAHYRVDVGNVLDRNRIKPRGEELYRRIRYIAESLLSKPLYFEARPIDELTDPTTAEVAKWVVESELLNPSKRFDQILSGVVWGGIAARMWCAACDFDPDIGEFGEIVHRRVDPRRITWSPSFDDPHDPCCEALTEECYMPFDQAKNMKGWNKKALKLLQPDEGRAVDSKNGADPNLPAGQTNLSGLTNAARLGRSQKPMVTIIKRWYKRDYTKKSSDQPESFIPLDPPNYYMGCSQCHYESARQADVPDQPMPEQQPGGCPECGGDITRIEATKRVQSSLVYPKGQRLVIAAPYTPGLEDITLFDGPWPNTRDNYSIRTFPYLIWRASEHPIEPMGVSETFLAWTQTIAIDSAMRMGYEQMNFAKALLLLPRLGLEDYRGEPFMFTDQQGQVAFYTGEFPPNGIEFKQGEGLNAAWSTWYEAMVGSLKSNEGTSELGMTPSQSKNIPVGTIDQLVKSGNIPIDGKLMSLRRELSMYAGVVLDYARCTYTEKRAVRYKGQDGRDLIATLASMDIPNADVVISDQPAFAEVSQEKERAWQMMVNPQMAPYRKSMAKAFGFPPSIVRDVEADEEAMKQDQQNQPQGPTIPVDELGKALADLTKAFPGSIGQNQIDAWAQMVGLPPREGPSVAQMNPAPPPAPNGMGKPAGKPGTNGNGSQSGNPRLAPASMGQ